MDRKKVWTRTIRAYNAMVYDQVEHQAKSPQEGITRAYNGDVTDEFIEPIVLLKKGKQVPRIAENDAVIFFNLRSDRARQLAKPFVQHEFEKKNLGFAKRKKVFKNLAFVAMTDFGPDLDNILTAFPSRDVKKTLPLLLEGKKQLYIAESEKYAHVTFFFNGGYDHILDGEEWVNIPSPHIDRYDKDPAMSTPEITKKIISSIKKYDFICVNFACPDMIGHTGNFTAAETAVRAVDKYVKAIYDCALKNNFVLIITADHGNVEYMRNLETGEKITEHTLNPVPFIIVGKDAKKTMKLKKNGFLSNVAPTILELFEIPKPKEMTKKSLL